MLRVPNARGIRLSGLTPAAMSAVRRFGNTALMAAVLNDHHEIVEQLIVARADLNTKSNIDGCALPLGPVRRRRRSPTLPIAPAPSGRTALHIAAWNGCTKSAVALLVGGADHTITNVNG